MKLSKSAIYVSNYKGKKRREHLRIYELVTAAAQQKKRKVASHFTPIDTSIVAAEQHSHTKSILYLKLIFIHRFNTVKMYLILTLLKMLLGIKELVFSFSMMLQLLLFATMFLTFISNQKKYKKQNAQNLDEAPGPKPWPILGSLHLMAAAQLKGCVPYAAFTALKNIYGNVFSITLGATKCVVVNDEQSVREVLISKDSDFDSRPDFKRFDALFGGDKQNCK